MLKSENNGYKKASGRLSRVKSKMERARKRKIREVAEDGKYWSDWRFVGEHNKVEVYGRYKYDKYNDSTIMEYKLKNNNNTGRKVGYNEHRRGLSADVRLSFDWIREFAENSEYRPDKVNLTKSDNTKTIRITADGIVKTAKVNITAFSRDKGAGDRYLTAFFGGGKRVDFEIFD